MLKFKATIQFRTFLNNLEPIPFELFRTLPYK